MNQIESVSVIINRFVSLLAISWCEVKDFLMIYSVLKNRNENIIEKQQKKSKAEEKDTKNLLLSLSMI